MTMMEAANLHIAAQPQTLQQLRAGVAQQSRARRQASADDADAGLDDAVRHGRHERSLR